MNSSRHQLLCSGEMRLQYSTLCLFLMGCICSTFHAQTIPYDGIKHSLRITQANRVFLSSFFKTNVLMYCILNTPSMSCMSYAAFKYCTFLYFCFTNFLNYHNFQKLKCQCSLISVDLKVKPLYVYIKRLVTFTFINNY